MMKPLRDEFTALSKSISKSPAGSVARRKHEMQRDNVLRQAESIARTDQDNQIRLADLAMAETSKQNELGLQLASVGLRVCTHSHQRSLNNGEVLSAVRMELDGDEAVPESELTEGAELEVDESEIKRMLAEVLAMGIGSSDDKPERKRRKKVQSIINVIIMLFCFEI